MQTKQFSTLRNILAIRLDNIGDVVMTGPALRALRQAYPDAHITLMASPAGSQTASLLPWINDVITWRAVWQEAGSGPHDSDPAKPDIEKERALVQMLRERSFDAAFIFTSFSQSPYPPAYACYMAGIPVRVGQSKEFGGSLLSHWILPLDDSTHQVDRNLYLIQTVGIPVESADLELSVLPADQHSADALLADAGIGEGQPFLCLAPGASAAARRYDEARFAEIARRLVNMTGLPLILIGSQREAGRFPALETLAMRSRSIHSFIGRTSVAEMAAVIHRSALLLANNSGSMHIGTAFRRPMVILFSGTELVEQWFPRTENVRILNRMTECTPCHGFQCPYQLECLDITPDEVVETALELLQAGDPVQSLARTNAGPARR